MKKDTTKLPKLTRALSIALENKELFLHYQPQISLVSGSVVAAEALMGWNQPEIGTHTADNFLLLAEKTGMIVPVGDWVIKEVCRQIKSWQELGLRPPCISINLSLQQFERSDVVQTIMNALKSYGVSPALIGVEIKEHTLTDGSARVLEALRKLHAAGINIALDHFGAGSSSFANFKNNFFIEGLKIDKFFVVDIVQNPDDAAIVSSIISMAQRLGVVVAAVGVETEEQANTLKRLGCDIGQGFYFSKPLQEKEMIPFMAEQHRLFD